VIATDLSRRAIAPVLHHTDMLTTGAIAHRLICCAELDELSGEIMEMLQEVHS